MKQYVSDEYLLRNYKFIYIVNLLVSRCGSVAVGPVCPGGLTLKPSAYHTVEA